MSKFVKGQPRPANSGRKRGTGNRTNLYIDLANRLEREFNYDVVKEITRLARSKATPLEWRARLNMALLQFLWPKKMAVQHSGKSEQVISVEVRNRLMSDPAIAAAMERAAFIANARPGDHLPEYLMLPPGDGKPQPIDAEFTDSAPA